MIPRPRHFMRPSAVGVSALALSACATTAPPPLDPGEQVQRHIAAVQSRNMRELEATITRGPDLLLILPSGTTTRTREDYLAFHRRLFANRQWMMTFEPIHLQALGDYAHALYRVSFDGDGAGPAPAQPAFLSLGFRREGGEWLLVHDQNTPVAQ